MKRLGTIFLGALVALGVILSSCSEDSENPGNPPELPPRASMSVNLGNFPQNEGGRVDNSTAKTNFAFAALNVGFWQTIVGATIVIPAVAFDAASDHSFEYQESDGRWKSEYTVGQGGSLITAELFAETTGETVKWEMYLSQAGSYDQFLWFTGESRVDNSGGEWTLYASPQSPREVLTIDWDRVEGDAVNSLYTLTDETSTKTGSYIEYGVSAESDYSHYYDVSVVDTEDDDYDLSILYNEETKVGRVKSNAYFGDPDWRCWDESFDDTACE